MPITGRPLLHVAIAAGRTNWRLVPMLEQPGNRVTCHPRDRVGLSLRHRWMATDDPMAGRAGWSLSWRCQRFRLATTCRPDQDVGRSGLARRQLTRHARSAPYRRPRLPEHAASVRLSTDHLSDTACDRACLPTRESKPAFRKVVDRQVGGNRRINALSSRQFDRHLVSTRLFDRRAG